MAQATGEATPKKVPQRNDLDSDRVYANTRAAELMGQHPDFVYQRFTTDVESPGYIGGRLRRHEYGKPGAYVMVGAWQQVNEITDPDTKAVEARTDQGHAIDTVQRHGRQITCRIHKSEFAKYGKADEVYLKQREKDLFAADKIRGRQASMTAVVSNDDNADRNQMLREAGHPL
jgi:hypothetical protein